MQEGLGSLRGRDRHARAGARTCCRRYEAVGVDQVIFVLQAGPEPATSTSASRSSCSARRWPRSSPRGASERERTKADAAGRGRRAGAGPPLAAARGAAGLRDRRAGRAGAGGPRRQRRRPARARRPTWATRRAGAPAPDAGGDGPPGARRERRAARAPLRQPSSPSARSSRAWPGSSSRGSRSASRATSPTSWRTRQRAPRRWMMRVKDGAASAVAGSNGSAAVTFRLSRARLRPPGGRGGRSPGAALLGPLPGGGRPGPRRTRARDVRRAAALLVRHRRSASGRCRRPGEPDHEASWPA